jgi:peptidoglycan hydrolase CwlO-like protein
MSVLNPNPSQRDIEYGAKAAIQLLDSRIGALLVERDNLVATIEATRANIRLMEEQKEDLERRIEELRRLRERMVRAMREEFGIDQPSV